MSKNKVNVQKATGKLGILTPGMGAVATTFMAGVMAVNKGLSDPIGSLTQMGRIRIGKRTKKNKKQRCSPPHPLRSSSGPSAHASVMSAPN